MTMISVLHWMVQHPLIWMGSGLALLPFLALLLLNKRLERGPLPHEIESVPVVQGLERARRAEAHQRKLLKAQRRIHYSDLELGRDHESRLLRLMDKPKRREDARISEETVAGPR